MYGSQEGCAPLLQEFQTMLCTEAKPGSQCPHEKLGLDPGAFFWDSS